MSRTIAMLDQKFSWRNAGHFAGQAFCPGTRLLSGLMSHGAECASAIVIACVLAGCSARPEDLALEGKIQRHASVKSSAEITINAPPQKVWQLLTDIPDWPKWEPSIIETSMSGKLQPGTLFTWNAGGMTVHSKLALVEPYTRLSWTGNVFNAHAIHVWTLEPLPGGRTLVKTDESINGFLLAMMYSSDDLAKSHQVWLDSLKSKAEEPIAQPKVKTQAKRRKR